MGDEKKKYADEVRNLWEELEEAGEEGDKSFYRRFTMKTTDPGFLDSFLQKMSKVHFTHMLDKTSSQGRAQEPVHASPVYPVLMVIKAVRHLQTLVKDHIKALEFIREIFKKQDEKLTKQDEKLTEVERRVSAPGEEVIA